MKDTCFGPGRELRKAGEVSKAGEVGRCQWLEIILTISHIQNFD